MFMFLFPENVDEFTTEEVEVLRYDSVKRDFDALRKNGKKDEAKAHLKHCVSLNRIHNIWKSRMRKGKVILEDSCTFEATNFFDSLLHSLFSSLKPQGFETEVAKLLTPSLKYNSKIK